MKIENQVCSEELSKQLKLGVKPLYVWVKYEFWKKAEVMLNIDTIVLSGKKEYSYPAYTVAELLDILPKHNGKDLELVKMTDEYACGYPRVDGKGINYKRDKNPANACAKLLVCLKENKLVN